MNLPRAKEITRPLTHPLDGLTARKERKKGDGRPEHLCDYLRAKIGDLDGTEVDNRRAAWSLILRAEKASPGQDAVNAIERLIDIALEPTNWHANKVTNFRYLLNHARQIANDHRAKRRDPVTVAAQVADHFARKSGGGIAHHTADAQSFDSYTVVN